MLAVIKLALKFEDVSRAIAKRESAPRGLGYLCAHDRCVDFDGWCDAKASQLFERSRIDGNDFGGTAVRRGRLSSHKRSFEMGSSNHRQRFEQIG